jgi:hypothetical protein
MRELKVRTVLLLGRRPSAGWDAVVGGLKTADELVVLSLGYPVTPPQRAVLLRAQEMAAGLGAWFDALLVTSTSDVLSELRPDDVVHVAAGGLEERRLQRLLETNAR